MDGRTRKDIEPVKAQFQNYSYDLASDCRRLLAFLEQQSVTVNPNSPGQFDCHLVSPLCRSLTCSLMCGSKFVVVSLLEREIYNKGNREELLPLRLVFSSYEGLPLENISSSAETAEKVEATTR